MKRIIGFVVLGIVLISVPLVLKNQYHMHIVIMAAINSILALSFMLTLSTGQISLGQAGFWAIGGYTSALLVMRLGIPFWVAMPLAGAATAIIGLVFGYAALRSRGRGTFIMLSFAFAEIVRLIISNSPTEITGGHGGLHGIPHPNRIEIPFVEPIEFVSKAANYYLILFLLVITALVFYALYTSRIGRAFRAVLLSPHLAETLGIDVFKYKRLAFTITSFFTGLAGSFFAHYLQFLSPEQFHILESLYIQIFAIIGGTLFFIAGPIVGACFMTFVPEFIRATKEVEPIVFGTALLLVMALLPGGLVSLPEIISRLFKKIRFGRLKRGL